MTELNETACARIIDNCMNLETFSISYCDDIEVEAAMQSLFSLAKTILENS